MLGEVGGIMAAGIEMEFVRDAARSEDFVERGRAGVEAVIVVVTKAYRSIGHILIMEKLELSFLYRNL